MIEKVETITDVPTFRKAYGTLTIGISVFLIKAWM